MARQQADLFLELAVHGLLGGLASLHAALRELPGVFAHALAPEHLVAGVAQDDAHIQAIAIAIDHRMPPDTSLYCKPADDVGFFHTFHAMGSRENGRIQISSRFSL